MLTAMVLLVTVGCVSGEDAGLPSAEPGAVRLAAVGDSITAADSADFDAGELGSKSWVRHALGEDIAFAGGWAVWGATTSQMADGVATLDADVLVVLAGTNDTGSGADFSRTAANIETIVDRSGVEEVVLSAVPPIDAAPRRAVDLNVGLEGLADRHGWTWVPQPRGLADGDSFAPGMADDGLHPSEEGARLIGESIGDAVRD